MSLASSHTYIRPTYKKFIKYIFSNDLEISLLDINPREIKTDSHKDLYMNVNSRVLLTAKDLRYSKCPSLSPGDQINKLWHIDKRKYHSAIKAKQSTDMHKKTDGSQKNECQGKEARHKILHTVLFHLYEILGKVKTIVIKTQPMISRHQELEIGY